MGRTDIVVTVSVAVTVLSLFYITYGVYVAHVVIAGLVQ
jgi:hypothetical protein